jgi:hypothetical protein
MPTRRCVRARLSCPAQKRQPRAQTPLLQTRQSTYLLDVPFDSRRFQSPRPTHALGERHVHRAWVDSRGWPGRVEVSPRRNLGEPLHGVASARSVRATAGFTRRLRRYSQLRSRARREPQPRQHDADPTPRRVSRRTSRVDPDVGVGGDVVLAGRRRPRCQRLAPVPDGCLGREITCPRPDCEECIRVSPFVVAWSPSPAELLEALELGQLLSQPIPPTDTNG